MFVYMLDTINYALALYNVQKRIVKILEESGMTYNDWNDLQHFLNEDISKALAKKQETSQSSVDNEIITYEDVIVYEGDLKHAFELLNNDSTDESKDDIISVRW